jgi:hypothetical protein
MSSFLSDNRSSVSTPATAAATATSHILDSFQDNNDIAEDLGSMNMGATLSPKRIKQFKELYPGSDDVNNSSRIISFGIELLTLTSKGISSKRTIELVDIISMGGELCFIRRLFKTAISNIGRVRDHQCVQDLSKTMSNTLSRSDESIKVDLSSVPDTKAEIDVRWSDGYLKEFSKDSLTAEKKQSRDHKNLHMNLYLERMIKQTAASPEWFQKVQKAVDLLFPLLVNAAKAVSTTYI